jgi:hypothetical protein
MSFVVDRYRKVTISLGGRCVIACRHCYTTAGQFIHDQPTTPAAALAELGRVADPFDVICISGDTDCFLDPDAGLELITGAAHGFPHADVMFTSRLVPEEPVVAALSQLACEMAGRRRLLLPGISLISMRVPNFSEASRRIPSAESRLRLLGQFAAAGMACLLALRPTFPFRLVGRDDVRTMIQSAAHNASAVLGEIMLLDAGGQLATRIGVSPSSTDDRRGQLTFLDQPSSWHKRTFRPEVAFAAQVCRDCKVPYFLRSGMALAYIRQHWDWGRGALDPIARIASDWPLAAPDP